jgi:hypothetical protein
LDYLTICTIILSLKIKKKMHGSSKADGKNGLVIGAIDFTAGSLGE